MRKPARKHLSKLAERAWSCLEQGELGETDHSLLLKVIDENPPTRHLKSTSSPMVGSVNRVMEFEDTVPVEHSVFPL